MPDSIVGLHSSGNTTKAWARDFNDIFFDQYTKVGDQAAMIFNQGTPPGFPTLSHFVKRGLLVTVGAAQAMQEGQGTPYDTFIDGPNKTVYPSKYGLGLQVTKEAMSDDRQGIFRQALAKIGESMKYTEQTAQWDMLNSGFGTTRTGIDTLALFSASHTVYGVNGTTYSNLQTGSLSKTTLQLAIDKLKTLKDERGKPIIIDNYTLVVPPELEWKAKEYTMSELTPDSAENNINSLKGSCSYMVSRYLTSTTAWFVVANKGSHDMQHYWFDKPTPKTFIDDNTDNTIFKSTMRMIDSFWNWRGVVGSAGT